MKSAASRIAHYNARTTTPLLTPAVAAVNALQKANFATRVQEWVPLESAISQILDDAGVPTTQYPFYLAFGGELYGMSLSSSGETAAVAANNLITLYTTRGLDSVTLTAIRDQVFNIAAPIAP